jgi:hypothetical protein
MIFNVFLISCFFCPGAGLNRLFVEELPSSVLIMYKRAVQCVRYCHALVEAVCRGVLGVW